MPFFFLPLLFLFSKFSEALSLALLVNNNLNVSLVFSFSKEKIF